VRSARGVAVGVDVGVDGRPSDPSLGVDVGVGGIVELCDDEPRDDPKMAFSEDDSMIRGVDAGVGGIVVILGVEGGAGGGECAYVDDLVASSTGLYSLNEPPSSGFQFALR